MKKAGVVGIPLLAFCAAVGGTLAAQGRLDAEGFAELPVIGGLVGGAHDPPGDDAHAATSEDDHAPGSQAEPRATGEHEGGHEVELPDHDGEALRAAFELPRPFEAEELERLTLELAHARDDYREKARALAAERAALERLGADLLAQRSQLEQIMGELASQRSAIDAERIERESHYVRLSTEESAALTPVARTYESMQPQAAAERLDRLELDQAAKVLALMKARKAAKVLEVTQTERAAKLSQRLAGLRREAVPEEERR
ncbi:MAG: hypothetical protein KDD82_10005 [Planctomycetes bacterium]|nr:hypothetical protein [Planctomycetota bacterium]